MKRQNRIDEPTFQQLIANGWCVEIAYRIAIKLPDSVDSTVIQFPSPGVVNIEHLDLKQRFYGRVNLTPQSKCNDKSEKVVRVRSLLFMNAKVYLTSPGKDVLLVGGKSGYLQFAVNANEHRKVIAQIDRKRKKGHYNFSELEL